MKQSSARSQQAAVAAMLCLLLAGCRHTPPPAPVTAAAVTPNVYVPPPPQPNLPPMEAPPPKSVTEAKSTVTPELKPKRKKKAVTPPPTVASRAAETPDLVAGTAPVPASPATSSALGELSPGGSPNPQQQQQIADRIATIEHRLSELPAHTTEDQKKQISQVRLFLKQASDALKTGDAEGATNLTTKAGLLLDDILKTTS